MNFNLTNEEYLKIQNWLKTKVYPELIEKQKNCIKSNHPIAQDCWDDGYPYEGAIGGGLTYCFTPTSIGTICKVKYGSDYELDVTNYDEW